MKWFLAILPLLALAGCQTPRTSYTNGLIVWCSTSAVGIGWGEYIEVAAGGKLKRVISGNDVEKSELLIDNTFQPKQADGADKP
jgi:hypothetical protein